MFENLDTRAASSPAYPPQYSFGPGGPRVGMRVSRVGSVLFASGLVLIAVGILFLAATYYIIESRSAFANLNLIDLYDGYQAILTAFGITLVGMGWVLDQRAVDRAMDPQRLRGRTPLTVVGFATFGVGVGLVAAWGLGFGYFALLNYYQTQLNLWQWTYTTLDTVLAIGVLLIAVGWLVQHLVVLARLERGPGGLHTQPPRHLSGSEPQPYLDLGEARTPPDRPPGTW